MDVKAKELVIYQAPNGKTPFEEWLNSLRDVKGRAIIRKRLNRLRLGNLGDCKSVGGAVLELRIDYGPGYRVYLTLDGDTLVILLCGGDKSSQARDIKKAQEYLRDYLS